MVLKPYYLPSTPLGTGTTHGSPYDYDAHCAAPRLWTRHRGRYAPGTRHTPGRGGDLLEWLDIRLPNKAEFPVPESLGR